MQKTQSLMLCCRRLTYVRFMIKYPETLFLWISMILPIGLLWHSQTLESSAELHYNMVRQNMTHLVSPYAKWCRENNSSCIPHQYCILNLHIFSLPSRDYRHYGSNCFQICLNPHCSNPIECFKQCREHWVETEKLIERAYMFEGNPEVFFILGSISGLFWILCCIGSFIDYFEYVKYLNDQAILKRNV